MDDLTEYPVFFECHSLLKEQQKKIEKYFRIHRKSRGGDCGPLIRVNEKVYSIAFKYQKDQQAVLQKYQHSVDLGDGPLVFTVRGSLEPLSSSPSSTSTPSQNFTAPAQESPKAGKELEEELASVACSARLYPEEERVLVRNLAQPGAVDRDGVKKWEGEVDKLFKGLQERYHCHCEINPRKVKALLQSRSSHQTTDEVKVYSEGGMAIVVGEQSQVDARLRDIEDRSCVREKKTHICRLGEAKLRLLWKDIEHFLRQDLPGVKVTQGDAGQLVLEGSVEEILTARHWISDKENLVLERSVSDMSPHLLTFLRKAYRGPGALGNFLGVGDNLEIELRDTEIRLFSLFTDNLDDTEKALQGEFKEVNIDVPNCSAVQYELQLDLKSKENEMNQGQCRVRAIFGSGSTVCLLGHTKEVEELREACDRLLQVINTGNNTPRDFGFWTDAAAQNTGSGATGGGSGETVHVEIVQGTIETQQVMRMAIKETLTSCENRRFDSVAFPVLGAGIALRFPESVVARVLQEEVDTFKQTRASKTPFLVRIVIHPDESSMAFQCIEETLTLSKDFHQPDQDQQAVLQKYQHLVDLGDGPLVFTVQGSLESLSSSPSSTSIPSQTFTVLAQSHQPILASTLPSSGEEYELRFDGYLLRYLNESPKAGKELEEELASVACSAQLYPEEERVLVRNLAQPGAVDRDGVKKWEAEVNKLFKGLQERYTCHFELDPHKVKALLQSCSSYQTTDEVKVYSEAGMAVVVGEQSQVDARLSDIEDRSCVSERESPTGKEFLGYSELGDSYCRATQNLASLSLSEGSTVVASYCLRDGLQVLVCQGDITKQDADALVNAANEDLDHCRGVAAALSKAGGPEVQKESSAIVKQTGKIPTGDVVVTTGGNLNCKKLLHAVGPVGGKSGGKERVLLEKTVQSALNLAENMDFKSIAMPCISSGIFSVPVKVCSEAIITAVKEFGNQGGRSLSRIILIDNREEVVRAMQDACDRLLQAIHTGNNTPRDCEFEMDAAAKATGSGATAGGAGETVHVEIVQGTIETQQVLRMAIQETLTSCENRRFDSVAFPVLGSGIALRFPESVVARVLQEEVDTFKQTRASKTPFLVRVVIHPDDQESSMVMQITVSEMLTIPNDIIELKVKVQ
eukprot:superscaffoldBa00004438_g18878